MPETPKAKIEAWQKWLMTSEPDNGSGHLGIQLRQLRQIEREQMRGVPNDTGADPENPDWENLYLDFVPQRQPSHSQRIHISHKRYVAPYRGKTGDFYARLRESVWECYQHAIRAVNVLARTGMHDPERA